MIIVQGTKQKEETYGLIANAWDKAEAGGPIQIIQPNDLGGKSLEKKLLSVFSDGISESKNKSRYITITKTNNEPDVLEEWRSYNELQFVDDIGFYSMPGIFGWNKIDKGSTLLLNYLPDLKGTGSDFGCGYGYLTKNILKGNGDIQKLYAFDNDGRAVEACRKNVTDNRAVIDVADCIQPITSLPQLDFIIMNPPFHDGSVEDRALGQKFIENAAHHLKPKGHLYMVANRHLPYEKTLSRYFKNFETLYEDSTFKIFKT